MLNGIAVFVMLTMLFMWCGKKWRQRLAGFGFVTDISVHLICQFLLGGANEGRLAVLFGCVMFNLGLMTYRKLWGYQSISEGEWKTTPGLFNFRRSHGTSSP
jgi:hypothetical protein